jgi:hypothetical protein
MCGCCGDRENKLFNNHYLCIYNQPLCKQYPSIGNAARQQNSSVTAPAQYEEREAIIWAEEAAEHGRGRPYSKWGGREASYPHGICMLLPTL